MLAKSVVACSGNLRIIAENEMRGLNQSNPLVKRQFVIGPGEYLELGIDSRFLKFVKGHLAFRAQPIKLMQ